MSSQPRRRRRKVASQLTHIGAHTLVEFDKLCRQLVREMAEKIRKEASTAQVIRKTGYDGVEKGDVVTTADLAAQDHFMTFAEEHFSPMLGLIGEENGLRRPSRFAGPRIVLTADPLDGTKTFANAVRAGYLPKAGQVSAMLGLIVNGEPIAGYICDVSTLTTYLRPPYGTKVLQVSKRGNMTDTATLPRADSLAAGTLLWHGKRPVHDPLAKRLIDSASGKVVRFSDSIGLAAVRVFTGEFVGLLRSGGGFTTPWDDTPVQAMCRQGDVVVLRFNQTRLQEVRLGPLDRPAPQGQPFDLLYVRRSLLSELEEAARTTVKLLR